jgi:hypothetical protein
VGAKLIFILGGWMMQISAHRVSITGGG